METIDNLKPISSKKADHHPHLELQRKCYWGGTGSKPTFPGIRSVRFAPQNLGGHTIVGWFNNKETAEFLKYNTPWYWCTKT